MSAAFTPGPWSYSTSKEGWSYTINIHQADDATYTPDWSDVAIMTCQGERQQIQGANARLIAAAPELLEALQKTVVMLEAWHAEFPDDVGHHEAPVLQAAQAAVAKATGSAA